MLFKEDLSIGFCCRFVAATGFGAGATDEQNGSVHPSGNGQHLSPSFARDQATRYQQHHRRYEDGTCPYFFQSRKLLLGEKTDSVQLTFKRVAIAIWLSFRIVSSLKMNEMMPFEDTKGK